MGNTIGSMLNELRTDHRNMVLLLSLLEAETERLSANEKPDYDLLSSVMTYMAEYPDAVHHPREDRLYQHLAALRPNIDDSLQRVESDHKELEHAGRGLCEGIEAAARGRSSDSKALAGALQRYAKHLRSHMYWEEQQLFDLADEVSDELIVDTEQVGDPLFGRKTEKRFRRLLGKIQRRMVWDAQQYMPS